MLTQQKRDLIAEFLAIHLHNQAWLAIGTSGHATGQRLCICAEHTYMHACKHAYIHTYIHAYIHTYIHVYQG